MKCKNVEEGAYFAVLNGELEIDNEGCIWRIAGRHGTGIGTTKVVPCKPRRSESIMGKYLAVSVMVEGIRYQAQAHRLVFKHFNGSIPEGLTVNHKNGNKHDNRPENLELATQSEQMLHCCHVLKTGRAINVRGINSFGAKLLDEDIVAIRILRSKGDTLTAIASVYGICMQNVSNICLRKTWRHIA